MCKTVFVSTVVYLFQLMYLHLQNVDNISLVLFIHFLFFFLQLVTMQNEMQKQMAIAVAVPAKEGKRLEAALGRSMEKAVKANSDALWARFQEENAKQEKAARERLQQLTNTITNCLHKDLPALFEKTVKRELTAFGQSVARTISPVIEKTISTSITESFQVNIFYLQVCVFLFHFMDLT